HPPPVSLLPYTTLFRSALMLVAKAAKLLVLGDQSVNEALLGHAWPPCGGRDRCKTSKASVPVGAGFVMALINNATPVRCSWLRVTVYSLRPARVSRKPHEVAARIKWTALALKMAVTARPSASPSSSTER